MTVESASFVSGLSESQPPAGDPVGQGDDHIRLMKQVLKATFPNASHAFSFPTIVSPVTSASPANADSGTVYPVDASAGAVSISLPASPDAFTTLSFYKYDFTPNKITINGNGKLINGLSSSKLYKPNQLIELTYSAVLGAWQAMVQKPIETGTFIDNAATSLEEAVLANGVISLGNASSGADLLGDRYRMLYEHLWNSYTDTTCPVNTGRGANSAADWAANKRITMPALNGYIRATSDTQGGATGGRITNTGTGNSGIGAAAGSVGGSQSGLIAQSALPNVAPVFTGQSSNVVFSNPNLSPNSTTRQYGTGGSVSGFIVSASEVTATVTPLGTVASINGNVDQTYFNKMPPVFITRTHMAL